MKILVWAGLFLVLVVVGSALGAAGMVGMPIATVVGGVFGVVAAALVMWGIVLFATRPRVAPVLIPIAPARGNA